MYKKSAITTFTYLTLVATLLSLDTVSFTKKNLEEEYNSKITLISKPNLDHKQYKNAELISVKYKNEDLIDIINQLAETKGVNIVMPVGEDLIQEKVTFQVKQDMPLNEVWNLLYVILEVAGYSMIQKKDDQYTIVKTSPEIATQALPLYIGTPADQLPDIEEQIRYIYFLSNLKIDEDEKNEIISILKAILPETARSFTNQDTNSIIIIDTARNIKSAMKIIEALDQTDFKEDYEVLPLRYVSAEVIADIFKEILGTSQSHRYRLDTRKKSEVSYFSKHLKIIGEPRTNALILLGRRQAIERVKNFIYSYIDVELESGGSILHVYQLQYLDANKFAEVLQKIVGSVVESSSGQARGTDSIDTVERFFEGVIVRADTSTDEEPSLDETGLGEYKYYGGNKIIVAAKQEDWIRIRRLIEQLDTPQPQVIIEVLIADLSLDDTRVLASILRNPQEMAFPQDANFQSAQASATLQNSAGESFTTGIIVDNNTNPTTIAADLLRTGVGSSASGNTSIANGFPIGTTLVSFNDRNTGQTWGLLELRKLFDNDKILSNPHVIATNNQQAEIVIGQQRLLIDQASGSEAGTTQVTRKWIPANLIVKITPRISSANTVNLNVEIKIDRFEDPSATNFNPQANVNGVNNIDNRWVYTNANVHNTDILALGGLTRVDFQRAVNRTPLLGRIPILGYFFKDRNNNTKKTNLTVFISPTIVPIRLRGGIGKYTEEYIEKSKIILKESTLFESLQDPITRFFFGSTITTDPLDEIERFVSKDEFKQPDEGYTDIRELATVNLDTAEDNIQESEKVCCKATRMKELLQNKHNPLA